MPFSTDPEASNNSLAGLGARIRSQSHGGVQVLSRGNGGTGEVISLQAHPSHGRAAVSTISIWGYAASRLTETMQKVLVEVETETHIGDDRKSQMLDDDSAFKQSTK